MIKKETHSVYLFRNVQNGKVYIGQSCNIPKRCAPCNYKGSIFFYRAIEKYGWDSFIQIVLKEGLTQELANMWEKTFIEFFNSTDARFGYNLAEGGAKSCALYGEKNGFYHKKHTEAALKTMSDKKRGGRNPMARSVLCVNTNVVFPSAREASEWCGTSRQQINRVCRGERKHTGFHPETKEPLQWRYYTK